MTFICGSKQSRISENEKIEKYFPSGLPPIQSLSAHSPVHIANRPGYRAIQLWRLFIGSDSVPSGREW